MSRLSDIISYKRSSGQGTMSSIGGGIKERLKEKFDPRQLINQKGLMVALFPQLKAYKAKTGGSKSKTGKSIEDLTIDTSSLKPILDEIQFNTKIAAKNLSVLPAMHRDFNVFRQNLVKLVKHEKIDAATKSDMYFKAAKSREEMYESQLDNLKKNNKSPTKVSSTNRSNISFFDVLMGGTILVALGVAIKEIIDNIEKIRTVDIKKSIDEFSENLTNSIDSMVDMLKIDKKNIDISEVERELDKFSFATLSEKQKTSFLREQEKMEGYQKDQFNPGAMVYRNWQKEFGGTEGLTKIDPETKEKRVFAKFPNIEKGREAQRHNWESKAYRDLPLGSAIRKWVAPNENSPSSMKSYKNYSNSLLKSLKETPPTPAPPPPKKAEEPTNVEVSAIELKTSTRSYGEMSEVKNIILHHTDTTTLKQTLNSFQTVRKEGYQLATQFVVDRDGKVYRVRKDKDVTYHVGKTHEKYKNNVTNENSIGIEIVSKDSSSFTEAQKASVKVLVDQLSKKYGIERSRVFGHGEISPRKMRTEGRELAEEIRKIPLSPVSLTPMGNLGDRIETSSFDVSIEGFASQIPIVYINNNSQENIIIDNKVVADSGVKLKDLFSMCVT